VADYSIVPPKEIIDWTNKNSPLPTIGCWGFFVEDGGPMAIALSPYEQGEIPAGMALNIIEKGIKPAEISIKESSQFLIYVDRSGIKKYGIKLPSLFEAFARATGHYY
jgi:ABC-type uncharacterized transport system substrate-binding protein